MLAVFSAEEIARILAKHLAGQMTAREIDVDATAASVRWSVSGSEVEEAALQVVQAEAKVENAR